MYPSELDIYSSIFYQTGGYLKMTFLKVYLFTKPKVHSENLIIITMELMELKKKKKVTKCFTICSHRCWCFYCESHCDIQSRNNPRDSSCLFLPKRVSVYGIWVKTGLSACYLESFECGSEAVCLSFASQEFSFKKQSWSYEVAYLS